MASKITVAKTSDRVYHFVESIPRGKVVTYGQLAAKCKVDSAKWTVSPRTIGWILHQNKQSLRSSSFDKLRTAGLEDPEVPCHRVVDRNGRIAPSYAFGGAHEQRKRLLAEGVKFKDEIHVDLPKCIWEGKS